MGHIPTAISLAFTDILTEDRKYKSKDELIAIFKSVGIKDPLNDQIALSC
jgi:3-mercaptopyruvate sulfurtransferase SseA